MAYATIDIEGGLFSSDLIERIGEGDANIKGQSATDFGLPRSRSLSEEIQRAFSDSRVYWDAFGRRLERSQESRTTLTRQDWAAKFFELLGFPALRYQRAAVEAGGAQFTISHRINGAEEPTPIHIVAVDQGLDERRAGNRRSPHTEVQDFLNRSEALWGVATNGGRLRLLRDSARLSKPTYLEFDIKAMNEGNAYSEFVVLYRLMHSTRFPLGETAPHECWLENYYNLGIEEGGRVREKLRDGVKKALQVLGNALASHPGNEALRRALRDGTLDETGYYRQLLNFVYRMLFLMVAEERKLLFMEPSAGQTVYNRYYSVARLRDRAEQYFAGDRHGDLWAGLAETFRLCRDDDAARRLNLAPLNGELFGEAACGHIEAAQCSNESLLTAVLSLSTFKDGGVRRRVNYAALDVEEFGSVYESLLDYRPVLDMGEPSGTPPSFDLAAGTQRKETGSYYTPPELVRELVNSALVPVMEERLAAATTKPEKVKALLDLRVCDPASGSGHFLLAAARRIARELAKIRADGAEPTPFDYRRALRTVVRHCIYAVDKNPLAVDLCKVALWIECHTVGLPLGFLDHHVKCGDSLVGVMDLDVLKEGIPDTAYNVVTGDDKKAAKSYRDRNKRERTTGQRSLALDSSSVDTTELAEDYEVFGEWEERTADEVKTLEELYGEMRGPGTSWWQLKTACDLWTYAFFAPLRTTEPGEPDLVPTTDNVRSVLDADSLGTQLEEDAFQASRAYPYFHWPLEFPDVFKNGGFDVVLGNPPWDQIQPEEIKFFGIHAPDIAKMTGNNRKKIINKLPETNPELNGIWQSHKRAIAGISKFARASKRFPLTSVGKINMYSAFVEMAGDLITSTGHLGMIIPTGIANDKNNEQYFRHIVNKQILVSLYDFENRQKVFPGIDSRIKFCLLTVSGGSISIKSVFASFLLSTEHLQETERRFSLSAEDFLLYNPNTNTCPNFRTERDMQITRKIYCYAGILWKEAQDDQPELNPWGVKLSQMFNMTTHSHLFRTHEQLTQEGWKLDGNIFIRDEERYLPLYESKLFNQYDHRFATFIYANNEDPEGVKKYMTSEEKADPHTLPLPRYWVQEQEVFDRIEKLKTVDNSRLEAGGWRLEGGSGKRESDSITSRSGQLPEPPIREPSAAYCFHYPGSAKGQQSGSRMENCLETDNRLNQRKDSNSNPHPNGGAWTQRCNCHTSRWFLSIRGPTNSTNERTCITTITSRYGMSNRAPILHVEEAISAALMVSIMNSIVLDFVARTKVGGTDLSFFIIKQLPILPPEKFVEKAHSDLTYIDLIVPRVLELTYTAHDLEPFARDLGYEGPPFVWDDERRHRLKSELDAIYAHMYKLEREELEWILCAPYPSASFPTLKKNEMKEFNEYRTKRYVLAAYDQMARGELPDLSDE